MSSGQTIVLIEDDRDISATVSGVLSAAGYHVVTAPNGIEGQQRIEDEDPDLVITDMMMPQMGGFPVLEFINSLDAPPKVIMITANEGSRHKAYAEMLGVSNYLRKPFAMDDMLEAVAAIFEESDEAEPAKTKKKKKGPITRTRKQKSDPKD